MTSSVSFRSPSRLARSSVLSVAFLVAALGACGGKEPNTPHVDSLSDAGASNTIMDAASKTGQTNNPILAKWEGPNGGVPAFDRVKVADLGPALEEAMKGKLADIERIAGDPAAPTFENTIAAP